jgi:NAD(P)H dehydrogenase (quinone)
MKILVVYAHPEPRSLNGALKDFAVATLRADGHDVVVSDLYAIGWNAVADANDFLGRDLSQPLHYAQDSKLAFAAGTQAPEIVAEQQKLLWCDALILQFPLWWFSMPAILKGWFERVYAYGFAYGVGEHSDKRWGDRYGEGTFAGKRAMLSITAGGWSDHYGERGINGPIDDLLFPIHHGVLYYPGFEVLPPFVVYRADKFDAARYDQITAAFAERIHRLFIDPPIAFRMQNGGDYEIPSMTLRPGLEQPGQTGFRLHVRSQPSRELSNSANEQRQRSQPDLEAFRISRVKDVHAERAEPLGTTATAA